MEPNYEAVSLDERAYRFFPLSTPHLTQRRRRRSDLISPMALAFTSMVRSSTTISRRRKWDN